MVQVQHGEQAARALGPVLAGEQQRARLLGVAARAQRAAQRARPAQRGRQLGAHGRHGAAAAAAARAAALHVHRVQTVQRLPTYTPTLRTHYTYSADLNETSFRALFVLFNGF